jgi:hypothetical protein
MTLPATFGIDLNLSASALRAQARGPVAGRRVAWKSIKHMNAAGGCD